MLMTWIKLHKSLGTNNVINENSWRMRFQVFYLSLPLPCKDRAWIDDFRRNRFRSCWISQLSTSSLHLLLFFFCHAAESPSSCTKISLVIPFSWFIFKFLGFVLTSKDPSFFKILYWGRMCTNIGFCDNWNFLR